MIFLPILAYAALGAVGGLAASRGTAKVREWMNEDETITVGCRRCGSGGPHRFAILDRSWAGGAVIGAIGGAAFGTVAGVVAKRIFRCRCGAAMYEDGTRPSWNADAALDAFINAPRLKDQIDHLQQILSRNQELAKRHSAAISELERQLLDANADKAKLEKAVAALLERLKREAA